MSKFHQRPNLYIGEVSIKVTNLQHSIRYYKEVIGLKVLEEIENKAVLTADGQTPFLILEQPENVVPKQGRTAGLYHFAILLPSRSDLGMFLQHLIDIGYQDVGAGDHLVSEAFYLNDPDGNGIEVYSDRPEETWTWKDDLVEMSTLQIDATGILAEANGFWQGMPAGTIMGHIHLHVSDLEKAKEFYTKGLGYDVVSYYPQAIFMSTGKYHHHIAINTWAGVGAPPAPGNSAGLNWYTIVVPSEEGRKRIIGQLTALNVNVQQDGNDYITTDPSGNRIRLVVR